MKKEKEIYSQPRLQQISANEIPQNQFIIKNH